MMATARRAPRVAVISLLFLQQLLLLLLLRSCTGGGAPVVRTRQGGVRGTAKVSSSGRHLLAFYNIPFAKPPVGPLRFKSPQPPDGWEHIRDATAPGAWCPQVSVLSPLEPPTGTEDCLYLNVFTPQIRPSELFPVMVWIHGGGFVGGAATFYEYGYLLDHDIVLVAINYRIGSLGFLSTGDEISPGNYGLKDQVLALRWVQENIEAFGGDPGSVTIFGESAGGASTHYLMLSPLARALALNSTLLQEFQHDGKKILPMSLSYDVSPQVEFITEKIYNFYFPSGELTYSKITELYSDALFNWNTDEAVRKYKDVAPVYYYMFSYQGELGAEALLGVQEDLGISHGDDLLYLFSNTSILPIPAERPKEDNEMAKIMTKLWTDFVKRGNPTPTDELVHWPRVTSDSDLEYLDIGQTLQVKKGLFQERIDFWRSLPVRDTQQQSNVRDEL
ncbi:fatty acyl-CoA hydrolase precursor, medium chain-like [Schistocerca nitens]|uniref:fatty acyl-CoA hydrolase precursor, medium chain-like n=1 Tax=Schistocerca nitens TaxID=7011 RepID=UPI002117B556|nr:fatty acyl-CoA hydrolase precursor, medium chain-like [Schistocerca nitens]